MAKIGDGTKCAQPAMHVKLFIVKLVILFGCSTSQIYFPDYSSFVYEDPSLDVFADNENAMHDRPPGSTPDPACSLTDMLPQATPSKIFVGVNLRFFNSVKFGPAAC